MLELLRSKGGYYGGSLSRHTPLSDFAGVPTKIAPKALYEQFWGAEKVGQGVDSIELASSHFVIKEL